MSAQGPQRAVPETRDDWETPRVLFDWLNDEFGFDFDAAATAKNHKAPNYATGPCSAPRPCCCGLCSSWEGKRVWCNPPYGRGIDRWIAKFGSEPDAFVVALLPANTDTVWFESMWATVHELWFLTGRVSFIREDGKASQNTGGSMVAIWRLGGRDGNAPEVCLTPWKASIWEGA